MPAKIMANLQGQLLFDFMHHPPFEFYQMILDFESKKGSRPSTALEVLQKGHNSEKR